MGRGLQGFPRRGFIVRAKSSLRKGHSERRTIYLSSAKNEYESFEIIVAPDNGHAPLKDVGLEFEDLISKRARIGKEKIRCYVRGGIGSKSDVLFPYNSFWSIMARQRVKSAQSFWVTVYVPADAKSGNYRGKLRITTKNAGSDNIGLRLRIWDFQLPIQMHLKTHFMMKYQELRELYPNLSDELFEETIFRYRVNLAEHRVSGQGYVAFPFRIIGGNRALSNFRRFDGDMNFLTNLGLNVYCLHLLDIEPHIDPTAVLYLLGRLQRHLLRKNWLDLAYLHLVNCRLTLRSQAELAKRASPGIKVVADVSGSRELSGQESLVDTWIIDCCRHRPMYLTSILRGRGEVWLDGACKNGRHGPLCWHHDQVDIRNTFWRMWSMGMRGLVYDFALPTTRSREPLIYTWEEGILNSVRWEIIRDGIEDYEYLSLLEESVGSPKGTGSMARIQRRASKLLRGIRSKGGPVNLAQAREAIAAILEAFSARAPRKVNIPS